jgi:hypothetical protein
MASYAYKDVVYGLPDWTTEAIDNYDGDPNYDGDAWTATAIYINFLERRVRALGGDFDPTEKDLEIARAY